MQVKFLALAVLIVGAMLFVGGCNRPLNVHTLRKNTTPEMAGIAHTKEMRKNYRARTVNVNRRQITDDWDSMWLMDRPSQSNPFVIP